MLKITLVSVDSEEEEERWRVGQGDVPRSDRSKSPRRSLHLRRIILPLRSISSLSRSVKYVVPFHLDRSSSSSAPAPDPLVVR